jgi:hypothetical protein
MTYAGKYLGTLSAHWPNKGSEYMAERQLYWRVRSLMGMVLPHDYGKRIYESDGVIQVENDEQRDTRLKDASYE